MDPTEPNQQPFAAEAPLDMSPSECSRLYEAIQALSFSNPEKSLVRKNAAILALLAASLADEESRRLAPQWAPSLLSAHLSAVSWPDLWGQPPHLALRSEIEFLPSYRETFGCGLSVPLEKYAASLLQGKATLAALLRVLCFVDPRSLVAGALSHAKREVLLSAPPPIR